MLRVKIDYFNTSVFYEFITRRELSGCNTELEPKLCHTTHQNPLTSWPYIFYLPLRSHYVKTPHYLKAPCSCRFPLINIPKAPRPLPFYIKNTNPKTHPVQIESLILKCSYLPHFSSKLSKLRAYGFILKSSTHSSPCMWTKITSQPRNWANIISAICRFLAILSKIQVVSLLTLFLSFSLTL